MNRITPLDPETTTGPAKQRTPTMRFTTRSIVQSLTILVIGVAASSSLLSQSAKPTIAHYAGAREDAAIPRPGMTPQKGRVAVVVTDPQNDFLSPKGVAWGVVGQSVQENNTVENIETLLKTAKTANIPVFVSPHYYYPQDHRWKFGGALEVLMHNIGMFDRKGASCHQTFLSRNPSRSSTGRRAGGPTIIPHCPTSTFEGTPLPRGITDGTR